jgi:hypothetical protein
VSCTDEKDLVDQQEAKVEEAREAVDEARVAGIEAHQQLDEARSARANCGYDHPIGDLIGMCSDLEDAEEQAQEAADEADDAYEEAQEALDEEENWLGVAEDAYCECMSEDPNP